MTLANASAVRRVFEAAGVEFIEENGGGPFWRSAAKCFQSRCCKGAPSKEAYKDLTFLPHQPLTLTLPRALLLRLALIVELLAARQGQFELGAALFVEIELERHQSHALALDRADQFIDLSPMQQQLSRSLRFRCACRKRPS